MFSKSCPEIIWGPKVPTDNLFFDGGAVLGIQEGAQNGPKARPTPPERLSRGPPDLSRGAWSVVFGAGDQSILGPFCVHAGAIWGQILEVHQLVVGPLVSQVGFILVRKL